jgi:hypothetical protein
MTATLAEGRLRTVDFRRAFTRQPFVADDPVLQHRLHAKKTLKKVVLSSGKNGRHIYSPMAASLLPVNRRRHEVLGCVVGRRARWTDPAMDAGERGMLT